MEVSHRTIAGVMSTVAAGLLLNTAAELMAGPPPATCYMFIDWKKDVQFGFDEHGHSGEDPGEPWEPEGLFEAEPPGHWWLDGGSASSWHSECE